MTLDYLCRRQTRSFNPHPCERGDTAPASLRGSVKSFNPHPCERGDQWEVHSAALSMVSIHTPARGVTRLDVVIRQDQTVSIHTPARGVTFGTADYNVSISGFNPHPCERGDRFNLFGSKAVQSFNPHPCERGDAFIFARDFIILVSIHTPARGVTGTVSHRMIPHLCFNPHPCERGDRIHLRTRFHHISFNPHPCERGDTLTASRVMSVRFQSTPLREG